ncbi:hypothetical protein DBR32_00810 [Taibaiella sp. KBW10]|uniref:hypothetical protein n=1 Tax=Taibaiella sp. KBW10 TaxID=2153357 RepID=UPI000F5B5A51|nr:hypothetical protein [Taibaiella sp. KBW10]RQO32187.1 hypothetical protein DBR32_00810 [Taibaiella sp. KBW10]
MFNILSYGIYLSISCYITLYVGWRFYSLGAVYLQYLLKEEKICRAINKTLLTCYYLVNMGYAAYCLSDWEDIEQCSQLIAFVSIKTGIIILVLSGLHYINLSVLYFLSKKQFTLKNTSI